MDKVRCYRGTSAEPNEGRPVAVLAVRQTYIPRLLGSNLRRNTLATGFAGTLVYFLGLATGPMLARSLGPSGRGALAAVLVPGELLFIGLSLGLPSAAAYLVRTFDRSALLATSTIFGLLIGIPLVGLLWPFLPNYYQTHGSAALFWSYLFLCTLPISVGANTALSLIWADGAGIRWNVWRLAPIAITAILTICLFVASRLTVWTALAATFIGTLSITALLFQKVFQWRSLRISLKALRCQLSFGSRVAIGNIADAVVARFDQALLVTMVSAAELGLYAVAVTSAAVSAPLAASIGLALFPELRRDESVGAKQRRTHRATYAVFLISSTTAILLAIFGPQILELLFGPAFAQASTPLRILLIGQIANDATAPFTARLLAANRPGTSSKASSAAAMITIAGLIILVPPFGIVGAALTTTISYVAKFVCIAYAVKRWDSQLRMSDIEDNARVFGG